jgi:hypothetical protein
MENCRNYQRRQIKLLNPPFVQQHFTNISIDEKGQLSELRRLFETLKVVQLIRHFKPFKERRRFIQYSVNKIPPTDSPVK